MNIIENTSKTAFKATVLATIIFWILVASQEGLSSDAIPFVFISIILIFIICFIAILFSIAPFYSLNEQKKNNKQIFKIYFPFYAIILFSLCSYFMITGDFESIISCFFTTTFFTAIQSWIWFFKTSIK